MRQTELFKGIELYEMCGNSSHLLETFDTMDEASEYLEDRVNFIIKEVYGVDSLYELSDEELETERELQFSYYEIKELS